MVGLSPIVANKQHRASSLTYLINKARTAEKTCYDLMDQCSTGTTSHQHYRPPHQPPGHDLVGGGLCQAMSQGRVWSARVCGPVWVYEAVAVSRQWMALAPTLTYATS